MEDKETLSFRTSKLKKKALDAIAESTSRDRSYIINQALDNYIELQEWQIERIQEGVRQAQDNDFVSDKKIKSMIGKFTVE